MNIEDFASNTPAFVLEEFFDGRLRGWGITMGRLSGLQNRFSIEAEGRWDEAANTLSLRERYTFDDGHVDTLVWTIIKRSPTSYEGRETHINGLATGEQRGNAFHWTYTRDVPGKDGSASTFGFSDWFWLHEPGRMTAHASLTKLAVEVATLNVFYENFALRV
jgi:hypothetical protein